MELAEKVVIVPVSQLYHTKARTQLSVWAHIMSTIVYNLSVGTHHVYHCL